MFQTKIPAFTLLVLMGACAKMVESGECRIILVGQSESGKSAAGNIILGKKVFENSFLKIDATNACQCEESGSEGDGYISIVNTAGLLDSNEKQKNDILNCAVVHSFPGPHAILLVINVKARVTEEERAAVKWIEDNFGSDASMYTILLFTHTDLLEDKTLDEFISESDHLRRLKHQCGGRYHAFKNNIQDRSQVRGLLDKIEKMVKKNGREHYTNDMYREAQRRIDVAKKIFEPLYQNLKEQRSLVEQYQLSLGEKREQCKRIVPWLSWLVFGFSFTFFPFLLWPVSVLMALLSWVSLILSVDDNFALQCLYDY